MCLFKSWLFKARGPGPGGSRAATDSARHFIAIRSACLLISLSSAREARALSIRRLLSTLSRRRRLVSAPAAEWPCHGDRAARAVLPICLEAVSYLWNACTTVCVCIACIILHSYPNYPTYLSQLSYILISIILLTYPNYPTYLFIYPTYPLHAYVADKQTR